MLCNAYFKIGTIIVNHRKALRIADAVLYRKHFRKKSLLMLAHTYSVNLWGENPWHQLRKDEYSRYDIEIIFSTIVQQERINLEQLQFKLRKMDSDLVRRIVLFAYFRNYLRLEFHSYSDNIDIYLYLPKAY